MVTAATLPWLQSPNVRLPSDPPETLDILSFEVASTMSRLISLYSFLSENEFTRLRYGPLRSRGVRYLNSDDEFHLLSLACCEKLDELDSAAFTVSRLGRRCSDPGLRCFSYDYEDLKQGIVVARDRVEFYSKQGNGSKIFRKMEKYVSATTQLHAGLESLAEMEASERKFQMLKLKLEPSKFITNNGCIDGQRIAAQRKQIKRCRETSLWNVTFDKSVRLMAEAIRVIFIRMCKLFGPFVSFLPCLARSSNLGLKSKPKNAQLYASGPIQKSSIPSTPPRFYSQELSSNTWRANPREETRQRLPITPPSTAGGSGLALRLAEIIVLAERYLHFTTSIDDEARSAMYEMLPESLRAAVKRKLERQWNREEIGGSGCQVALAEGWREAAGKILEWLAPMAHDTVKWQADRQLERQMAVDLDGRAKGSVLLVQTLHYSDAEKTEAAIVEVLVALSCVYRYEDLRFRRD
ncbi:unnamed protein product [Linum tenue]|uniref:Uncharacterized protein n=1 Tax=Linum tenue TaxID=586396 RepID=A0AAV0PN91_9ROSI|nr:unnamed protein product [Linum tenue]